MELIASGMMLSKVAAELGVGYSTVCSWNREPQFRAELDGLHQEIRQSALDRLRAAACTAADTLAEAAKSDWKAAGTVLRILGVDKQHGVMYLSPPAQIGDDDEKSTEYQRELTARAERAGHKPDLGSITERLRSFRRGGSAA